MNNAMTPVRIHKDDLKAVRDSIQIGDVIELRVKEDEMGKPITPRRIRRRVTAKYPFLVALGNDGFRVKTMTYVEIAMRRLRKAERECLRK